MKKIAVISDNYNLISRFRELIVNKNLEFVFHFYSTVNLNDETVKLINIKTDWKNFCSFNLILSLHCKQIFPAELTTTVKCINIHPGLNPYNRGWFPQVFSIINKLPAGATIHEIDEQLDHGNIIAQQTVKIESYDTSLTAYNKIIDAEFFLLENHIDAILSGSYVSATPYAEGNLNLKRDFTELCKINLDKKVSYREVLDHLRALSHGDYKNAFYEEDGRKIYVSISFEGSNTIATGKK